MYVNEQWRWSNTTCLMTWHTPLPLIKVLPQEDCAFAWQKNNSFILLNKFQVKLQIIFSES